MPEAPERQLVDRRLFALIGPAAVCALAAFVLSQPAQMHEAYRLLASEIALAGIAWYAPGQHLYAVAGIFIAAILIYCVCYSLVVSLRPGAFSRKTIFNLSLRWYPAACVCVFLLGCDLGISAARIDVVDGTLSLLPVNEVLRNATFLARALVFAVLMCPAFIGPPKSHRSDRLHWLSSYPSILLFILGTTAAILVFTPAASTGFGGIAVAQTLGTLAIFCLFVICLIYFTMILSLAAVRTGVPYIALLSIWVVMISWTGLADNHTIETRPIANEDRPTARETLLSWYRARADREVFERAGKPYPVFLIAAAGGGLYAADFTASALASIQDECPAFSQHVFAISAVSGGAVGSAMFAAAIGGQAQISANAITGLDPCSARGNSTASPLVRAMAENDFLAPSVAAALFPDFFQRFLPVPIRAFDRARALDSTLAQAWRRASGCNAESCSPFERWFLDAWRPDSTSPALVLNATDVGNGHRVVIAPFTIARDVPIENTALENFHSARWTSQGTPVDLRFGTAVAISARFPFLSPAAGIRFGGESGTTKRLLDGGIFENSGTDTLTNLLIDLSGFEIPPAARPAKMATEPWIIFHVIAISHYQLAAANTSPPGEILPPISALLGARAQRSGPTLHRLFMARGYNCDRPGQAEICSAGGIKHVVLTNNMYELPLGWQMSSISRLAIAAHIRPSNTCDPIPRIRDMFVGPSPHQRLQYTIRQNACTTCAVLQALKGEAMSGSKFCRGDSP